MIALDPETDGFSGQSVQLRFEYQNPAGGGVSNFFVDDLTVDCAPTGN